MKIHSQLISDEQVLRGSRNTVRLARDQVADQRVVAKRLEVQPRISHDDLRTQLRLLRTLAGSGFLDFEDVVQRDDSGVDVTFRHIGVATLTEVQASAGEIAVLDVLQQVCQSVAYLHSLDYLHGDLKPDNILIEVTGSSFQPHLTDLDLSIRRDAQMSRLIQGAYGYMAPEIEAGETLTESIDIYAFGRTVETYIKELKPSGVIPDLQRLADHCTRTAIPERPASMWVVFDALERLGRVHCGRRKAGIMTPPLRRAGLAQRVDRLKRVLFPDGDPRTGLCLVRASRGGGGSRVMRELCLDLQWDGAMTLRITHVTSLDDLLEAMPRYIRFCRQRSPRGRTPILWVFVETARTTGMQSSLLTELNELAIRHSCVIVCEGHRIPAADIPAGCRRYDVNPLTPRECVIATGHLIADPAVASANEASLAIAARGIPELVQRLMCRSLEINHSRTFLEPVNIDETDPRILVPWQDEYRLLTSGQRQVLDAASVFHARVPLNALSRVVEDSTCLLEPLNELVRTGWLTEERSETDGSTYRFCCRVARNAIRRLIGLARLRQMARHHLERETWRDAMGGTDLFEAWSLRGLIGDTATDEELESLRRGPGEIVDIKLVLCQMLRHYRLAPSPDARQRLAWAADVAVGFAALGSVRRQQMWANRALLWRDRLDDDVRLSFDIIRQTNRLMEMTGGIEDRRLWLQHTESVLRESDGLARGFVLSELSAISLIKLEGAQAAEYAHAANVLFERNAPEREPHIRCMNRCGLAYQQMGRLETAKKYLNESLRLSRLHGHPHIEWRSIGNLGYLARAEGDPQRANLYARAISHYYRITDEKILYVTGLRDQVLSLVDLGRLNTALRAARLAATLARAMAGELEYGSALNNLGWVLCARGEAEEAYRHLQESIRILQNNNAHEFTVWTRQNVGWLHLAGHLSEQAERICQEALAVDLPAEMHKVHIETRRILALAAIQLNAFEEAEVHLAEASRLAGKQLPKANAEIDSLRLESYLWQGELDAAAALLERISANPVFTRVQPLRLDAARHTGHYHMRRGDFDQAATIFSRVAEECRQSGRYDKHIETIIIRAHLADAMGNRRMARRLADVAEEMINRIRGALNESAL